LFEECLKVRKRILAADHPDLLSTMHSLGVVYQRMEDLDLALPLLEETLKLQRIKLGNEHPLILNTLNSLVNGYRKNNQPELALPLHEESLALTRKGFGNRHPVTLASIAGLAKALSEAQQLEPAEELFKEAMSGLQEIQFKHPNAKTIVGNACACFESSQQFEPAEAMRRQWLEHLKTTGETDRPEYAGELASLGLNLMEQGKWPDAELVLRECLTIREKAEPDAWTTFNTLSTLGGVLLKQKNYADAEPMLLAGYQGMKERVESIPAAGSERIPQALQRLIELYSALEQPAEVERWKAELKD
jgi:tetratricopeptide (TPR) repeat protein